MINGALIRGARGVLGWSIKKLAARAHVGTATIQRIEHANYSSCGQVRSVKKLEMAFDEAGVSFFEGSDGEIGVQIKPQDANRKPC